MKRTIEFEYDTQVVKDILESLPENSISFEVLRWDYQISEFSLRDLETGIEYTLTLEKAIAGFEYIAKAVLGGKLFYQGLESNVFEAGSWDSLATDALLQAAVFGEVIYG